MTVYVVLSEVKGDLNWHIHEIEGVFTSRKSAIEFTVQKNKELYKYGADDEWNYYWRPWTVNE